MRPDALVASQVDRGFVATPLLHGEWRRRMARRAIPSALVIATPDGAPTPTFQGVCKAAFNRAPPAEPIVDKDGRALRYFVSWLDR